MDTVQQGPLTELKDIGHEIHVWHASLDREPDFLPCLEATLSSDERARAHRFRFLRDRNDFLVARGLLRKLLGRYLDQSPADVELCYGQHGKPSLSIANSCGGVCFNLSHSSGLVVYAIARGRNLGIDVEFMRSGLAHENIAKQYFSLRELRDLNSLPSEKRDEGFYDCWTRKEAYLKARGTGLQIALDSFAVTVSPDRPAQFLEGVESCWHLVSYRPEKGFAAAVVYDGPDCPIKYLSLDSWLRAATIVR
jgi:4'-phosphopantetheinyl transferase